MNKVLRNRVLLSVIVISILSSVCEANDDKSGCSIGGATPYDPPTQLDQKERLKYLKESGSGIVEFQKMFIANGQKEAVKAATDRVAGEAANTLSWNRDKGALIEIVMEQDEINFSPSRLLTVNFLGTGSCPYDTLLESFENGTLSVGASDGYKIDETGSHYVWLTKNGDSNILNVVFPGSRGPLRLKALSDSAAAEVVRDGGRSRYLSRVLGLVDRASKEQTDQNVKDILRAASDKISAFEIQRAAILDDLRRAQEEAQRAGQAAQLFSTLRGILTVAQLGQEIQTALGPNSPKDIIDKIKSSTTYDGQAMAIDLYTNTIQKNINLKQDSVDKVQQMELETTVLIIQKAKEAGATQDALPKLP